jgi:acyl carrier protein
VMEESVMAAVRATLAEVLGIEPEGIGDDDPLLSLPNADSLRVVESVARIEDRLGVRLQANDLIGVNTVRGLAELVWRKT